MSASGVVHIGLRDGVLTITLDHPKANAFTEEMIISTQDAFRIASSDPQVRCVLLIGKGRFFSTGHDLKDAARKMDESFRSHLVQTFNPLILQIRNVEKPVIAAINGTVAGAALGVALACDLRIASESAQFVVGFLGIGLSLDSGISLFLPAIIGLGRATEYAFTNEPISAQQALDWGLVSRLVPDDQIIVQATDWATNFARGPLGAMGLAKLAFNKAVYANLEQVLDYEAYNQDIAGRGEEFREGLLAFFEKRPPSFI